MVKFIRYLTSEHYLSSRIVLGIDLGVSITSSAVALLFTELLFRPMPIPHPSRFFVQWMAISLILSYFAFCAFKTHRSVIRHSTLREIGKLSIATLMKEACMTGVLVVHPYFDGWYVPQTALIILDTLITLITLIMVRVAMVIVYDKLKRRIRSKNDTKRVLIYGIGQSAVAMAQHLTDDTNYHVVGFITYGKYVKYHTINELRVFYFLNEENLCYIKDRNDIDAILFTTPEDARHEQEQLISYAIENDISILMAPHIDEIVDGRVSIGLREIKIEDLLMRPEIEISMEKIRGGLHNKRILVTGAAGSIGSELCRQIAPLGIKELIMLDNAETPMHNLRLEFEERFPKLNFTPVIGDVRLAPRMDYIFKTYRPDIVFHAAAYKHVPLMEENPCEAILANVVGSRNIANKCIEYGAERMVMISTDKAVNPTNIMGTTKRLAEIYVQALGLAIEEGKVQGTTKFVTTRFGNVLGSNGSVIPRFREQIAKGGPVTVTHPEITRFFMTIPEACRLVMEAANMSSGNEIFVFDMGEPVRIADMARRMIQLAGYNPDEDIKIEYIGLRPGEKLYEEVLANEENTAPTSHGRIRVANVRPMEYSKVCNIVTEMEELARKVNITSLVQLMKRTVPEYGPENDKYRTL